MSDVRRPGRWWPVWAALRGLAIGVAGVAVAAGAGWAIIALDPTGDWEMLLIAILAMPLVLAVAGPVFARWLKVPGPVVFAGPALWAVILVCVWSGPARNQEAWPFDSVFSSLAILILPYVALAVWTSRPPGNAEAPAGDGS